MERIGIAGLPASGKTSLFNALTGAGAEIGTYSSKDLNLGMASVPDPRLDVLAEMERSKKIVPAQIEFVDVAGVAASSGSAQGLGSAQLGKLREADALVCVLRAFEAPEVPHPEGRVDPVRDMEMLETELCLADLEAAEKAVERYRKSSKSGDTQQKLFADQADAIKAILDRGVPISRAGNPPVPPDLFLITDKPVIYVVNIGEEQIEDAAKIEDQVRGAAVQMTGESPHCAEVMAICVQVEAEARDLDLDARSELLEAYGLGEGVTPRLIRAVYGSLDLITFLTAGEQETRAWTAQLGSKAPQAAGRIHSDMERGFIRMEVVAYDDLVDSGSMKVAKEKGLVRVEGKDYAVKEGDVIHVRFNV